jgi:hypothetical protein
MMLKISIILKERELKHIFFSAYHLIETCAAQERVHINKHQHIRSELIKNKFIFKNDTEEIWKNFQKIENQFRPKFAYGFSWTKADMTNVEVCYKKIEKICLEKLGVDTNG